MDEIIISPITMTNYEEQCKIFFEEHFHKDREVRFILKGSGYFDVRDEDVSLIINFFCQNYYV